MADGRFTEFTVAEAIEIAKRNDPGEKVPSVSRVLLAEIESLQARAEQAEAALSVVRQLPVKWRLDVELNGSPEWPSCGMQLALADEVDAAIAHGGAGEGEKNA